jgi:hypothetical protein
VQKNPQSKFVKKMDDIPKVQVHADSSRPLVLKIVEHGLVGQFMGIWPSPRVVSEWVDKNWSPLIQGKVSSSFCGKGFFLFLFETKTDRDLIFRSGPYFMGARGLYLNSWNLDFNPENDIPSVVPVWVRLPFLSFHCWNDETIRSIGNTLGRYIDRAEPRDGMHACARICVEVDLEKGLPEAIQLTLDNWSFLQQVDYEQLPFKCRMCHEYGHFAKSCPKSPAGAKGQEEQEQWQSQK